MPAPSVATDMTGRIQLSNEVYAMSESTAADTLPADEQALLDAITVTPEKAVTAKQKKVVETATVAAKTNARGKVYVGCRHPHGIVLQVADVSVELKGMNSSTIIGGYGLTEVAEDFWNEWYKTHSDWPMVVNGLVFAQSKVADLNAEAKELEDETTGFERLDPNAHGVEAADKK